MFYYNILCLCRGVIGLVKELKDRFDYKRGVYFWVLKVGEV